MPPPYSLEGDDSHLPRTRWPEAAGVRYEIDIQSLESYSPGQNMTTATARVLFDESFAFIDEMVGTVEQVGDDLSRLPPAVNPYDPQQVCTRVEQVDQGQLPDDSPTFSDYEFNYWPRTKWARYRLTFESLPYVTNLSDEQRDAIGAGELARYVYRRRNTIPRELPFPGGVFRPVKEGAETVPEGGRQTAVRIVLEADVEYTWMRVPVDSVPLSAINACLNKVNGELFDPRFSAGGTEEEPLPPVPGYEFDVETLLFQGYDESKKYFDSSRKLVCDVVYRFRERRNPRGWNAYLNRFGQWKPHVLNGLDEDYTTLADVPGYSGPSGSDYVSNRPYEKAGGAPPGSSPAPFTFADLFKPEPSA